MRFPHIEISEVLRKIKEREKKEEKGKGGSLPR